jgi:hypothetical protein
MSAWANRCAAGLRAKTLAIMAVLHCPFLNRPIEITILSAEQTGAA